MNYTYPSTEESLEEIVREIKSLRLLLENDVEERRKLRLLLERFLDGIAFDNDKTLMVRVDGRVATFQE